MHSRAQLYVTRTLPNQRRSLSCTSGHGDNLIFRHLLAGGFFFARPPFFFTVFSFSIVLAIVYVDDGQEIFDELFVFGAFHFFMENHDLHAMELKDPFNQFECKSGESVSIGNHNGASLENAFA